MHAGRPQGNGGARGPSLAPRAAFRECGRLYLTVNVSHACYVHMKATTDGVYGIRSIKESTETGDVSER